MPPHRFRIAQLLVLVLAVLAARTAAAQDGGDSGEINLSCTQFGVGGMARPGEWVGIRLAVKDTAEKQREVLIRIALPDPDGDRVGYERAMTTNPGVDQPLWTYLRLPARFKTGDLLTVEAFEALEQGAAAPAAAAGEDRSKLAYGSGRLLGSARFGARGWVYATDGLMGVVGSQELGLQKYRGVPQSETLPTGHERTQMAMGLDPASFPDRWMGLMQFDLIVWQMAPPSALSADAADALREWVERGGHLVVVLPRVGQTWTDEAADPLYDIMPRVRVDRHEGVSLEPLRALITTRPAKSLAMPVNEVLQEFSPVDGAGPDEAIPVLAAPGAAGKPAVIAVRRLVGTGMVTMIGLDVASRWMQEHAAPDPQLFWHRILGRRGELWSPEQFDQASSGRVSSTGRNRGVAAPFRESATVLDQGIPGRINMTGYAAQGVLLGFVVFVAYWLVAGPLGFALLKRTGMVRHAWVGFAAAAVLFTALAWGGATAIRPGQLDARHFTIFEHVYGQNVQRARSFVSVHVPQYGEATLMLSDPALPASQTLHNTIAPFDTETTQNGNFPDARAYRLESKNPDRVTYPSRSTVKQFQIDWAGGAWKMPRPVKDDGSPGDIHIEGDPESSAAKLRGILVHNLPAALKDVVIVVVLGEKDILVGDAAPGNPAFLARTRTGSLSAPWEPGEQFDLSTIDITRLTGATSNARNAREYLKALSGTGKLGDSQIGEAADVAVSTFMSRMYAMTFFHQLEPPSLTATQQLGSGEKLIQRKYTHGQDLSAWFTEPCVIVLGTMEGPSPVPLFVSTGGSFREVHQNGVTLVRWVYPLKANPPGFTAATGQEPLDAEPEPEGEGGGDEGK